MYLKWGIFFLTILGDEQLNEHKEGDVQVNKVNEHKESIIPVNKGNEHRIEVNHLDKIKDVKNLMKEGGDKKKTKVVLVFNEISQLESLIKGMNEYEITINQSKLEENQKDLESKRKLKEEEDKRELIENIPLGYKSLCILFNNLKLLEENEKLKGIEITDLVVNDNNSDVYDKIQFKKKEEEFVDSTGYFKGIKGSNVGMDSGNKSMVMDSNGSSKSSGSGSSNNNTNIINNNTNINSGKIYQTGLFHLNNLEKEKENKNNKNMKILLKHISFLKKKSIKDLFKEDCELNGIDKVIFFNNYDKNFEDLVTVCIWEEKKCRGVYKVNRGGLNEV